MKATKEYRTCATCVYAVECNTDKIKCANRKSSSYDAKVNDKHTCYLWRED